MAKNENSDPKIKRIGNPILKRTRVMIDKAVGNDVDLKFKVNRWIYARLPRYERRIKDRIKRKLFKLGMKCQCGQPDCTKVFSTSKNVEVHRRLRTKMYSEENCVLVSKVCHEKLDC